MRVIVVALTSKRGDRQLGTPPTEVGEVMGLEFNQKRSDGVDKAKGNEFQKFLPPDL